MSKQPLILESGRFWSLHFGSAVALLGIAAGCVLLGHQPLSRQLAEQQSALNELLRVTTSRTTLATELANSQRICTAMREQIDQAARRIGSSADVPAAIEQLAALAVLTDVKLLDLQPLPEQKYPQAGLLPLHCRIEASWDGLCRFLERTHTLDPPIRVERLQFGSVNAEQLGPITVDFALIFAPADSTLGKTLAQVRNARQP